MENRQGKEVLKRTRDLSTPYSQGNPQKTEGPFDRQAPDRGPLSPVRPTSELASTRALTQKQISSAGESIGSANSNVKRVAGNRSTVQGRGEAVIQRVRLLAVF